MRQDIADKWIVALRSGEYKQGSDYLCDSGYHCCLGVLCELYMEHTGDLLYASLKRDDGVVSYGGYTETLPIEVMKWSGVSTETGSIYDSDMQDVFSSLAEMNDSGHTFDELADIIHQQWSVL